MQALHKRTAWKLVRAVMATTGPIQKVVSEPAVTHQFCNEQGIQILYNDGYIKAGIVMERYLEDINRGVMWADTAWKNSCHFLDVETGKGYWVWPNAIIEGNLHYAASLKRLRKSDIAKAMFYFGAALHLVQDLCVPHHARGVLFDGHHDFEAWAMEHRDSYSIVRGGAYRLGDSPEQWMQANALVANKYYYKVSASLPTCDYEAATAILLPLAQRTTAGFMEYFWRTALLYYA